MNRNLIIALCILGLVGCNKSPEAKIERAQEKQAEAHADLKTSVDTGAKPSTIQDKIEDVAKANENLAKTVVEVAKDKVDAQDKISKKLADLETRVAKASAKPAETDPAKANEFTANMNLATTKMTEARDKVTAFAQTSPTEWQGPYEAASNALAAADEAVDKVD